MAPAVRQILVISTGLAPQVVTEMLWWLAAREGAPRVVPDAIHIVTTGRGAKVVREQLLGAGGKLAEFCREFGLPDLGARVNVLVPTEADLGPGDDTRDLDTNIGYANLITRLLRDLTADPDTHVHASLAGGRKTMSFYLGYAMSLLGREHDELSHVLVSPPAFENSPDFWWKPTRPRMVRAGGSCEPCSTGECSHRCRSDSLRTPALSHEPGAVRRSGRRLSAIRRGRAGGGGEPAGGADRQPPGGAGRRTRRAVAAEEIRPLPVAGRVAQGPAHGGRSRTASARSTKAGSPCTTSSTLLPAVGLLQKSSVF